MKLKERAKQLKSDLPAVYLSFKDKETPVVAKFFAIITIRDAIPIILIWILLFWVLVGHFI